jgi:diguanylate cyclase (GGDEF)-like protein
MGWGPVAPILLGMADPPTRANRFRSAFTIRRRLVAFGIVASIFAAGASYNSLAALTSAQAATERATNVASIQHYHQDAVNQLLTMQSALLEALLVSESEMSRTSDELAIDIETAAKTFDDDHEIIANLDRDRSLGAQLPSVDDAQALYVSEAIRLSTLATVDTAAALTEIDTFLTDAEPLFADLELITNITAAHAAEAAENAEAATEGAERTLVLMSVLGTVTIVFVAAVVALSIARQLRQLSNIAEAMAGGDLQVRNQINSADEVGGLARSFDAMADSFEDLVARLEQEASQDTFRRELFDALDMAGDETDVHTIMEEAMGLITDRPMELLISDSSKHHVTQAVTHPVAGASNCSVGSTGQCVAVRRGHRLVFESSRAIDACPHLKRRGEHCSAVCVPVTFNGESLGVIHTTGDDGEAADTHMVDQLTALASQAGARLGTINAFKGAREQATIDGLTGLRNRRTLENDVRALAAADEDYALIMCDLDHFKDLNDHFGHEMGDRALRLFGQILKESTREGDIAARLGGEEFVVVQPGMSAQEAVATVERIQMTLAARLELGDGARFTSSFGLSDTSMAADFDAALRIADAGLLASKDQGRDRWIIGDVRLASELARRGRPRGTAAELVDRDHGPSVLPDRI